MNEFDFNPINPEHTDKPADTSATDTPSAAGNTPTPTDTPAEAPSAPSEQSTTPSEQPPANMGQTPNNFGQTPNSFGQSPNNFGQTPNNFGQTPNNFGQAPNNYGQSVGNYGQRNANGSEYEVSFDSTSGKYTYTNHQAQNSSAFSGAPNHTDRPQKSSKVGKGLLALGLCATVLISALLGAGGGAVMAAQLIKNNNDKSSAPLNSPVQQSTVLQVSNEEVNYGSIAKAISTCYDSVVVIETYLSESYAEAGEASGAGSGVIWTADGYIVTCNHVVDGANVIRVIFTDGTSYVADVVGTDAKTDLAVLKIQATGLKAITARNTPLVLGETAIAIGNPLGVLANSASDGILSCLARDITIEGQTMSLLQTTAAVNRGNSGGGLFDINGSLIGIVNAKSTGDSVEGLGFAIPIETVMDICNQIIEQGFVSGRPQLGITVVTVTQTNASYIFQPDGYPALEEYATQTYRDIWNREHKQIVPGAYIYDASAVAGYADGSDSLKFGDMVLYVGTQAVESVNDIKTALSGYNAGDTIQLTILRGQSQTIIVNLILGQMGAN